MNIPRDPRTLTQIRGHQVKPSPEGWRWADTNELIESEGERRCTHCNIAPTYIEGIGWVDECFMATAFTSTLPADVTWACCGHGVEDGYIRWGNEFQHSTDALIQ